jgi:hypothetical protein
MAALVGLAGFAPAAHAGILPIKFNGGVEQSDGTYQYEYGVVLTSDSMLNPGDFFTLYDFAGYVPGSAVLPSDLFVMTINDKLKTPVGTVPVEDASIPDFTFTYVGTEQMKGQIGLGSFFLSSIYGDTRESAFTSRTHRLLDGVAEGTITTTQVPVDNGTPPPEVPEPATLTLVGLGLPILGLLRRRKA